MTVHTVMEETGSKNRTEERYMQQYRAFRDKMLNNTHK